MAAPVLAFTDPTVLSWFGSNLVPPAAPPLLDKQLLRSPSAAWLVQIQEQNRLPFVCQPGRTLPTAFATKIPTPPMGRMIVLTFPPIYKERINNTVNRPQLGQIWPRKVKST